MLRVWTFQPPLCFPRVENGTEARFLHTLALTDQTPREGNDGPWGTFNIQVGTPPQIIRVAPSTLLTEIWVTQPLDCSVRNCVVEFPGGLFLSNKSTTYRRGGEFETSAMMREVQIVGNGEYGSDTVGVELVSGNTKVTNQTVASIPSLDSEFGLLGLLPTPSKLGLSKDIPESWRQVSFFQSLQSSTRIAGRTWSYQAGAFNRGFYPSYVNCGANER